MKKGFVVLGLLGLAFVVLGIWLFYSHHSFPFPSAEFHRVWIPDNAEIYSAEAVRTGTFKIKLPFAEFKQSARPEDKIIAVYHTSDLVECTVEYYRPTGNGIFHYSYQKAPKIPLKGKINWEVEFYLDPDDGQGIFHYTPIKRCSCPYGCSFFLILLGTGFLVSFFLELPQKPGERRKDMKDIAPQGPSSEFNDR
jgi:hypothetical protein